MAPAGVKAQDRAGVRARVAEEISAATGEIDNNAHHLMQFIQEVNQCLDLTEQGPWVAVR